MKLFWRANQKKASILILLFLEGSSAFGIPNLQNKLTDDTQEIKNNNDMLLSDDETSFDSSLEGTKLERTLHSQEYYNRCSPIESSTSNLFKKIDTKRDRARLSAQPKVFCLCSTGKANKVLRLIRKSLFIPFLGYFQTKKRPRLALMRALLRKVNFWLG